MSAEESGSQESGAKFLGFDLSTQQLKAVVIDDRLNVCHLLSVNFDEELGEYHTRNGVQFSDDGLNSVSAPVNMWLKAMDLCLEKLRADGLEFSTIRGISGCAQQHGSVWWRKGADKTLANLSPDSYLHMGLVSAFSLRDSPIWMDSSTSYECNRMESYVGGPERMVEITGSRCYERFTGPQIAKVFRLRREVYEATEHIQLVSNFVASILIGAYAPFDSADASGMNLMDIRTRRWSQDCLEAVLGVAEAASAKAHVAGLKRRLGWTESTNDDNIVSTHEIIGRVSRYFVDRYGFSPECLVSAFTGDNPGSFAGMHVQADDIVISLGTSDTISFWLDKPAPSLNGHVFVNPIDESKFMGMVCFKNGSLTRDRVRDKCASGDWATFGRLLNSVPRGNFGNIGFYFDTREIHPLAVGDFRYNKFDERVDGFADEIEVRACLEGQLLRLYNHSKHIGFNMGQLQRVLVTGGASSNPGILQTIADVFRAPVYTLEIPNSACLGGAFLAKYAFELEHRRAASSGDRPSFRELISNPALTADQLIKQAEPTPIASIDVYQQLAERYSALEHNISINNPS